MFLTKTLVVAAVAAGGLLASPPSAAAPLSPEPPRSVPQAQRSEAVLASDRLLMPASRRSP